MKDEKLFAMLFSSIVLPCHYTTHSSQTAVVQWWYKSYCTDRTRDSFTFPEYLGVHVSDLGASSHLDCSDNSRTVRIVASAQGSSMTLAEHYKGRDISIINSNVFLLPYNCVFVCLLFLKRFSLSQGEVQSNMRQNIEFDSNLINLSVFSDQLAAQNNNISQLESEIPDLMTHKGDFHGHLLTSQFNRLVSNTKL